MIKDNIVFLREFLSEFQTTGAAFPTSRRAAEELTRPLITPRGAKRILELGPGTGSVTLRILEQMQEGDQLTICEINPRFMEALQKRLSKHKDYQRLKDSIRFFLGPAQELPEDMKYDVIVCALPFLNFSLTTVQEIFAKLSKVAADSTVMTYYEFIGLRRLGKSSVAPPVIRKRIKEVDSYFSIILASQPSHRRRVWFNMLPINIYTLQIAA